MFIEVRSINVLVVCCLLSAGCKKINENECPVCPVITSINPDYGHFGDTIYIHGIHFNETCESNIIKVNGKKVERENILDGDKSFISIRIPIGCGTGPVSVALDADLFSGPGPVFHYEYTYTNSETIELSGYTDSCSITDVSVDDHLNIFFNNKEKSLIYKIASNEHSFIQRLATMDYGDGISRLCCYPRGDSLLVCANNKILKYNAAMVSDSFEFDKILPVSFSAVWDIEIDPDDNDVFYASGQSNNSIIRCNAKTHQAEVLASSSLKQPDYISFFNKEIYIVNTAESYWKIQRIPVNIPTGRASVIETIDYCRGIVVDKHGYIYVTAMKDKYDENSGMIWRLDPDKNFQVTKIASDLTEPSGMCLDKNGDLYVVESYPANRIQRITLQ